MPVRKGISKRKMAEILEKIFHNRSTISKNTDITVSEINKWTSSALEKRYIAKFMDETFLSFNSHLEV
ncbi:MAG TPA: hypothetical protein VKU79_06830, partial [Thermoplasmataceae archaeon]|nr:hypothetical protein [Thermoplasmataceae archaeon]